MAAVVTFFVLPSHDNEPQADGDQVRSQQSIKGLNSFNNPPPRVLTVIANANGPLRQFAGFQLGFFQPMRWTVFQSHLPR